MFQMRTLSEKLEILGDSAKYDVSCSSSGSSRERGKDGFGTTAPGGICHTWSADGRCISLLKVLQSNACAYNCAYCANRRDLDRPRATMTPAELSELTFQFYRRNYIEGLFLSSGVVKNPDYTMELMIETMRLLRTKYNFTGYIHSKIIPGASGELVRKAGMLADRVSVNIELPSHESLGMLAPDKAPAGILGPMELVRGQLLLSGETSMRAVKAPVFAPAGQTTQMIIGATPESDLGILRLSRALYRKYSMKRVYYSAYLPVGTHPALPDARFDVPLLREHRLYQADFLMRFYKFDANEILTDTEPFLDPELDPKCAWALRNLGMFPLEVNSARHDELLRVPGIGVVSAKRIVDARRGGTLRPEHLKKLGVVMKRAASFVTAGGSFCGRIPTDSPYLRHSLTEGSANGQLSLFQPESKRPNFKSSFYGSPLAATDRESSLFATPGTLPQLAALPEFSAAVAV